jgi:hypothetical protein
MWRSGAPCGERPLLGWGPGGVKRDIRATPCQGLRSARATCNTPLQILVERGLRGFRVARLIAFPPRASARCAGAPRAGRASGPVAQHRGGDGFLVAALEVTRRLGWWLPPGP